MTWLTNLDDARTIAAQRGVPIFALLTVDWCPWCQKLEHETLLAPQVEELLDQMIPVRLDGDANGDLVDAYDFEVYPTALIFSADSDFVDLIEGFLEPQEYLEALKKTIEGDEE